MLPLDISEFTTPLPTEKKVGYVALIGRPNSGKSTFINTLLEEKVSAVSSKPQTTQRTIRGIYNDDDSQIVFFDTPGIHESRDAMNIIINAQAVNALKDADVIVRFIDLSRPYGGEEARIAEILENVNKPIITVYSKADISYDEKAEGRRQKAEKKNGVVIASGTKQPAPSGTQGRSRSNEPSWKEEDPETSSGWPLFTWELSNPFFLSSVAKTGISELIREIKKHLVVGPLFYGEDYYTDQDMETRIREVIREKLFTMLEDEIPYDTFVEIEEIEDQDKLLRVLAVIHVEKDSQKTIIIGKQASKLQEIGTAARKDLESIFDRKVYLLIRVKTHPHWKKNKGIMKKHFG